MNSLHNIFPVLELRMEMKSYGSFGWRFFSHSNELQVFNSSPVSFKTQMERERERGDAYSLFVNIENNNAGCDRYKKISSLAL